MWHRTFPSFRSILSSSFSTSRTKRVGTHCGTFHCDEALACFMLRLSKQFSGADIVRTRDSNLLEALDAVVDVGRVYDPIRHRYDHHQRDFDQVFGNGFVTKLSSAGIVYKVLLPFLFTHSLFFVSSLLIKTEFIVQHSLILQHFGLEIIANVLRLHEDHRHVHQLYPAIYRNFVEVTNFSMSCTQNLTSNFDNRLYG